MKYLFMLTVMALMVACMEDEVYEGPSSIDSVASSIAAPTSTDNVTVTAVVSGLQAVRTATLSYSINGGSFNEVAMSGNGNTFTGVIPAQEDGTKVKYFVTVVNEAGFSTDSPEREYQVGDPPTDFTKLRLNELFGAADTDEGKFIELYNMGDFPIKLKGVSLKKDGKDAWMGIEGEVIPAHGCWAIIGAKGTTERGFSSGFSNKKSVLVELFDPDGKPLDKFQRGEEDTGWGNQSLAKVSGSWSRVPDGTGKWMETDPTCGELNAKTGTEDETVVQ
ncbi:MAG: lamin tail domain-containing protein [Prevotella sp.]|nr:lamin tail domain-containing protein [Prevotella sp.]